MQAGSELSGRLGRWLVMMGLHFWCVLADGAMLAVSGSEEARDREDQCGNSGPEKALNHCIFQGVTLKSLGTANDEGGGNPDEEESTNPKCCTQSRVSSMAIQRPNEGS